MKKNIRLISQLLFILAAVILWQTLYNLQLWPRILFPSIGMIGEAFVRAFLEKGLGHMIFHSLQLLVTGLLLGICAALILSALSAVNEIFAAVFNMIVSMFDLIPGIALIPIAILWLGIGNGAIIFMVFHSVIWPMSRSIINGFNSVPNIYLEVGQNIGLNRFKLITGVFIPAAFPHIFSGLKVGWARAWRGLISAEMVFGGGSALGIGYYITDRRTNLDVAGIFATIIAIILIGLVVEYGLFRIIEKSTFSKWGMTR